MYEKTNGVAMGYPLSLVVANLYMEYFENKALESYPLKTREWKQFVDDTNFIWPHRRENLDDFLKHMNSQSNHIKFTMEIQDNNCLPFLDVLITKKEYGSLSHQVYRKQTHTDIYVHASSHHHPLQKLGIIHTLATRAIRISYKEHLGEELGHLSKTLQNNGYNIKYIGRAFKRAKDRSNKNRNTWKNIGNCDRQEGATKVLLPYI